MVGEEESIGRWIWVIFRCGRMYLDERLAPYEIGAAQLRLFRHLTRRGAVHQDELAEHMDVDKGTVARALEKLEASGYVERRTDPADRRAKLVSLTDRARQIGPDIRRELRGWSDTLTAGFSDEEQRLALSLLRRMASNAKQAVGGLRGGPLPGCGGGCGEAQSEA